MIMPLELPFKCIFEHFARFWVYWSLNHVTRLNDTMGWDAVYYMTRQTSNHMIWQVGSLHVSSLWEICDELDMTMFGMVAKCHNILWHFEKFCDTFSLSQYLISRSCRRITSVDESFYSWVDMWVSWVDHALPLMEVVRKWRLTSLIGE
jgi:hypothetical protein